MCNYHIYKVLQIPLQPLSSSYIKVGHVNVTQLTCLILNVISLLSYDLSFISGFIEIMNWLSLKFF